MTEFGFVSAGRIIFGPGVSRRLPGISSEFGSRALVVTGANPDRFADRLEEVAGALDSLSTFEVDSEPSIELIEKGVSRGRDAGSDVVIALGGGSVIDAGKAIAGLLGNAGKLIDYLEVIGGAQPLPKPGLPFIAAPTTAGTGSEVTKNAVVYSPLHRVKVSFRSPYLIPRVALVDPELTYLLPPGITAASGLDALTQVLEPFVSRFANPLTDGICREGLTRAARSIRRVYSDPDNMTREDMSLASLFGGLALANAGLGAVHGLAGPLGGLIKAPHGSICACLLPHVAAENLRALKSLPDASVQLARFREVAQLLTGQPDAQIEEGLNWLIETCEMLRIPRLSELGLTRAEIPALVEQSLKASSMKGNPVDLTADDLATIVDAAF